FLCGRGRSQVEGVVDKQIQGHDFTHLTLESALARNECVPRNVAPFPVRIGKYGRGSGTRYKIHDKSRKTGAKPEQIRSEARPCPCIVEGKLSIVPVLPAEWATATASNPCIQQTERPADDFPPDLGFGV